MHIVGLDLPDAIVHQPVGYETNRVIRNETNFRYETIAKCKFIIIFFISNINNHIK